ncbi:MAG: T9SS type A sorting domain-containing protein [Chitinophagaceae bacterium]|nr:T9SS type A sorting domain-containing protein [Chitinophagaceae bacterium]
MKKLYFLTFSLCLTFLLFFFAASAQNLIVNPSAEQVPTSNGWTAAQTIGSNCFGGGGWRIDGGNPNGFPAAQEGAYFFYPGCGGVTGSNLKFELYQDIDVSSEATVIDAGHYVVTFSGYKQSYDQTEADSAAMVVEFRDASRPDPVILGYITTDTAANTDGWTLYNMAETAPSGTRTIRVRLIGHSFNGTSVDSYFDNLSLTATNTLPVNWVSFTAMASAQQSLLKWQTSHEINNKGFYIERSANGVAWETIGFVAAAAGSASIYEYQFADAQPAIGINYYRIKQQDLDGKYEYSSVRNVQHQYSGRTFIFPNPADNHLSIVTQENKFKAQIIHSDGRVAATFINEKNISIQHLHPGVYYLRLVYENNRVENLKLLKH